jgi:hypothetical protein
MSLSTRKADVIRSAIGALATKRLCRAGGVHNVSLL